MALTFRRKAYGLPESEVENSIFAFKRNTTAMHGSPSPCRGAATSHPKEPPRILQARSDIGVRRRTNLSQPLVRFFMRPLYPAQFPYCPRSREFLDSVMYS